MFNHIKKIGDFRLSSGAKSKIIFDCSKLSAIEVQEYAKQLYKRIESFIVFPKNNYFMVGISNGGITLAHELSKLFLCPLVIYTAQNTLRGLIKAKYAILIDDVTTTGGSFLKAARILKIEKKEILATISLIRRYDVSSTKLIWPNFNLYIYEGE